MIHSSDEQTIIAQCTPRGSGAIALIRISGSAAIEITDRIARLGSGKKLAYCSSHTIHYGWVINGEKKNVDQVLFFLMHGPNTFTGQDTVEITCHNNQFLVEEIITCAIQNGARMAQPGEFSKRAVLNEKIDLIQAEAINELIHASTQLALKQSLSQLEGSFSHWIARIEKVLVNCLALSDASFEFLDEENMEFNTQIKEALTRILTTLNEAKATFNQQQQIRQGIKIALIGSVNAGKSSLFNALLNKNRAIVTEIAGTTRDVIEAGLYKNGNYLTMVDTAGLRQTDDIVEQKGIEKTFDEAQHADIILLIYDRSRALTEQESTIYVSLLAKYAEKIILIQNKADLPQHEQSLDLRNAIAVSATNRSNIDIVEKRIDQKVSELFDAISSPFLLNQRQFNLLLTVEQKLLAILPMLENPEYELISHHLKDSLEHLSELTGRSISEMGMDAVFKEFCVGK